MYINDWSCHICKRPYHAEQRWQVIFGGARTSGWVLVNLNWLNPNWPVIFWKYLICTLNLGFVRTTGAPTGKGRRTQQSPKPDAHYKLITSNTATRFLCKVNIYAQGRLCKARGTIIHIDKITIPGIICCSILLFSRPSNKCYGPNKFDCFI